MLDNSGPAANAFDITAGATALEHPTRAIYVGTTGTLVVTMEGSGASITFSNVPDGALLPIRVTHVTGGTATGIVGLW